MVVEVADRLSVLPEQTGVLAAAVGVAGIGFTTTVALPGADMQPLTETVTVYVPDAFVCALGIVGL